MTLVARIPHGVGRDVLVAALGVLVHRQTSRERVTLELRETMGTQRIALAFAGDPTLDAVITGPGDAVTGDAITVTLDATTIAIADAARWLAPLTDELVTARLAAIAAAAPSTRVSQISLLSTLT